MVNFVELPEVTVEVVKLADTPEGRPDTVNLTLWADPEVVAVDTVVDTDPPRLVVPEVGLRLNETVVATAAVTVKV